jgi:branched-chain amino acid transport system ATP-binding protein
MLKVEDIHTFYGLSHILQGVSLEVRDGEIVCLLGRNGVGKTTTLKSIMGLTPPQKGKVIFKEQEIQGKRPHEVSRLGISYVPEDRRVFPILTVRENLILGTKNAGKMSPQQKASNLQRIYNHFPILREREKQYGRTLSGGEQQMLTVARGLMGSSKVMLLDEPSEGLAPLIVKELMSIIVRLCGEEGLTLLLVEQNARLALKISNRGYVLEKGVVRFEGPSKFLLESEEVKERCGL